MVGVCCAPAEAAAGRAEEPSPQKKSGDLPVAVIEELVRKLSGSVICNSLPPPTPIREKPRDRTSSSTPWPRLLTS